MRISVSTSPVSMTPIIIAWITLKRLRPEFPLASFRSFYHILLKSIAKRRTPGLVSCLEDTHMAGRSVCQAQFQLLSTRLSLVAWERAHGNTTGCRGTLRSELARLL